MLVSDIYGGSYEKLGLPGDLIASSFGKTVRTPKDASKVFNPNRTFYGDFLVNFISFLADKFEERDVVRSLLLTISNCIGQIAYLYAKVHNLKRIYFGGYFIRGHPFTMRTISFAINYWSAVGFSKISGDSERASWSFLRFRAKFKHCFYVTKGIWALSALF